MNDLEKQERLLDLLTLRETAGLGKEEERELEELFKQFPDWADDDSIALTTAAINLSMIDTNEEMPTHLRSKILADAENFFGKAAEPKGKVLEFEPRKKKEREAEVNAGEGFLGKLINTNWLGWAVAAACVALALNIWLAKPVKEFVYVPAATPTPTPALPQQLEQLVASAPDLVKGAWTDLDPKKPQNVKGDVVWSNSTQKGFIRFSNLPVNDKTKETYQLWIFDESQNAKTPVDGGVFDVDSSGDVIIPIDAKIKIKKPTMFAVTAEKPGGVVVSGLEKVMAVAKVST
ncbi:MAG: anti-sigma factor [Pyrinomonadaceae bacterium]|nr:anti-sigma factor [Pyrinomonadaceae bacterium]